MNITPYITRVTPIPQSSSMTEVFHLFQSHRDLPFLPVVNSQERPVGVIREYHLKAYAYGMFGRELIRRERIESFIDPCPVIAHTAKLEEILAFAATETRCEGIIITNNERYEGILYNQSLFALFDENRRQTLKRLSQAQKMEAIGTLAGGIAHDFNNILMPIMGYAELVKETGFKRTEKEVKSYLDQIITATVRAKELVAQILAFSRQKAREKSAVRVSSIVKEVAKLLRSSLPTTISIDTRIADINDAVFADPTEIHQVIMNLCTNAAHAMRPSGGVLTIGLERRTGGSAQGWKIDDTRQPDPCICLWVGDSGHGIEQSVLSRIFDPFFTTKKQGEGTGLGLSVVHGIVKACGGTISIDTSMEPGKSGTSFFLYFPVSRSTGYSDDYIEGNSFTPCIPEGRTISVLLVDDEQMIVEMIRDSLEEWGFTMTCTENSLEALRLFKETPNQFDVVITDQTMPGLTGTSMAERMLEIRPDLPIVLITGYSETVSAEIARALGIRGFLMKPVDMKGLAETVIRLAVEADTIEQD